MSSEQLVFMTLILLIVLVIAIVLYLAGGGTIKVLGIEINIRPGERQNKKDNSSTGYPSR